MNLIQFYAEALDAVAKGKWLQNTQTYESIVWKDPTDTIPKEVIDAKVAELKAEFQDQAYARNRQSNYPNEHDLIVALWEKVVEGRSESADALEVKRQEVKTAHPKPE
tara:strand:+ start:2027 stop:2350 length:324 start_codon:yes stop_codon:yes gene_type:complete